LLGFELGNDVNGRGEEEEEEEQQRERRERESRGLRAGGRKQGGQAQRLKCPSHSLLFIWSKLNRFYYR